MREIWDIFNSGFKLYGIHSGWALILAFVILMLISKLVNTEDVENLKKESPILTKFFGIVLLLMWLFVMINLLVMLFGGIPDPKPVDY